MYLGKLIEKLCFFQWPKNCKRKNREEYIIKKMTKKNRTMNGQNVRLCVVATIYYIIYLLIYISNI